MATNPGNHAWSDRLDFRIPGKHLQPGDQPLHIGTVRDDQAPHRELLLAETWAPAVSKMADSDDRKAGMLAMARALCEPKLQPDIWEYSKYLEFCNTVYLDQLQGLDTFF